MTAAEAKRLGLVNKVVSSQPLLEKSLMITAKNFASKPTKAIGMIKTLMRKSFDSTLDEILTLESEFQEAAGNTEDFKEGIASFLEKRKSAFKGK